MLRLIVCLQQGAMDFIAMTMGAAAAACIAPLKNLMPSKPDAMISTAPKFVIMAISYSFGFAVQTACVIVLSQQSWYQQDTGTSYYVSVAWPSPTSLSLPCKLLLSSSCAKRVGTGTIQTGH